MDLTGGWKLFALQGRMSSFSLLRVREVKGHSSLALGKRRNSFRLNPVALFVPAGGQPALTLGLPTDEMFFFTEPLKHDFYGWAMG
jgi:hypothetical protein